MTTLGELDLSMLAATGTSAYDSPNSVSVSQLSEDAPRCGREDPDQCQIQITVTDFQTGSQTGKADVVNLEGVNGKKNPEGANSMNKYEYFCSS